MRWLLLLLAAPAALAQTGWQTLRSDPLAAGFNGPVLTLARAADGALWAGGAFTEAPGAVRAWRVARWDGTRWSGPPTGPDGPVQTLLPDGNGVVVGGEFSRAGEVAARNVARWDGQRWSALGEGVDGSDGVVLSLDRLADGRIVAGGRIYADGAFGLAAWDGTAWAGLDHGVLYRVAQERQNPQEYVSAVAVGSDGALTIAGVFRSAGGTPAHGAARRDGERWTGWVPAESRPYFLGLDVVARPDGRALVGGIGSKDGEAVGLLEWTGQAFETVRPGTVTDAYTVGLDADGQVVFGGRWDGRWGIGRLTDGGIEALADDIYPAALLADAGDLLAAGSFGQIGGAVAPFFARYDGTAWSGVGRSTSGAVTSLAFAGRDLWAAGSFDVIGQTVAAGVARWDGQRWHDSGISGLDTLYSVQSVVIGDAGALFVNATVVLEDRSIASVVIQPDGAGGWTATKPVQGYGKLLLRNGRPVLVGGLRSLDRGSWSAVAFWNGTDWDLALEGLRALDGVLYQGQVTAAVEAAGQLTGVVQQTNDGTFISLRAPEAIQTLAVAPDGTLLAAARESPAIYALRDGRWSQIGEVEDYVTRLVGRADGSVYAISNSYDGLNPGRLVLVADGVSHTVATADRNVYALAVRDGQILLGGAFTSVDGDPAAFVAVRTEASVAAEDRPSAGLTVTVAPNPSRGNASVVVVAERPGPLRVEVLDVLGRRLAVLLDGPAEAGRQRFVLPPLAPGTYVVRAEGGDGVVTRLLTVVR